MKFGIITLFPEMFQAVIRFGVTGRAIRSEVVSIKLWNLREFTSNNSRNVDDRPYGGGPGMVMMIEPLKIAIDHAKHELGKDTKVIYLSPQGRKLNQNYVYTLIYDNKPLILVCGRYQGIDERLIQMEIDEEWSIGDYVLSGGELAAMVLIDVIARILPGTLRNKESKESNSFFKNKLDYPHYTRPKVFNGIKVPSILLSGHHDNISRWRLKQSLGKTWMKRPDLLKKIQLTVEETRLLEEFKNEHSCVLSFCKKK